MLARFRLSQSGKLTGVLTGAAASLLLIGSAGAQQVPPIEEGSATILATRTGDQFELADAENGHVILGRGYPFFELMGPGIEVTVDFHAQPTGADIIYHLVNNGSAPAQMGRFSYGKLNLGSNITYQKFGHLGEPIDADINNYVYQGDYYPSSMYSPVYIVRNEDYAVGFSLQYPILDYKHDVRIMLGSTPADADQSVYGPRGWFMEYRFGDLGEATPAGANVRLATMTPGEHRTYVVSIRVTRNPTEWIRTLVPYRNYFKSMYGGVSYRRDPRPIRPILMAVEQIISPNNPYGWSGYPSQRPDQYTFQPWVENIKHETKYARTMIWAPTGLYNERSDLNFPYQFTSRWTEDPHLASALDPENGFPSVARSGMILGLWWGRSVEVARTWNPAVMENFDPNNRDHREMAFREMDLAVQAGATEIGLDTFSPVVTPIWELYPWIRTLRERYPTVKFCIEPLSCDIMHTQAAMFAIGWHPNMPASAGPDWNYILSPYYLADFINPGHETWAAMSYHMQRYYHMTITPDQVQRDAIQVAGKGFVPVMLDDLLRPQEADATDSWTTTVPTDLQRGSGWNTNFARSMVVRGADGKLQVVASSGAPERPGQQNEHGESSGSQGDAGTSTPGEGPLPAAAGPDGSPLANGTGSSNREVGAPATPAAKVKPGSKAAKAAAANQTKRAASTTPSSSSGNKASTARAGSAVSSAALARAGLLGKSSSGVFNKNEILRALQRMNDPSGGNEK